MIHNLANAAIVVLTEIFNNTVLTEFHLSFLLSIIKWKPKSASCSLQIKLHYEKKLLIKVELTKERRLNITLTVGILYQLKYGSCYCPEK